MVAHVSGSTQTVPSACSTLVDLLQYRAVCQSEQTGYIFLVDGESQEVSLTYRQLDKRARSIAAYLQSLDLQGRALLLYPPGLEFIAAFFGCLYAGLIPVPAYPPRREPDQAKVSAIATDAAVSVILTAKLQANFKPQIATEIQFIDTDAILDDLVAAWQQPAIDQNDLALLQYTSGTTGNPKGVMISHRNLLHNSAQIHRAFEHTPNSRGVIWLPLYHDMGLIGGILQPLYGGFTTVLMPPVTFLQKPLRWLQAISRYQATTSGGPNFAYDFCVQKIAPEHLAGIDLSHWDVAFTGAEPICAETLNQFAAKFAVCGFRRAGFYPCYGLAEATLFVSGGCKTTPPTVHSINAAEQRQSEIPLVAESGEERHQTWVSCGRSQLGQQIAIVDPVSCRPCEENQVGEVWLAGDSIAQGYWNRSDETAQTFQAILSPQTKNGTLAKTFLRTGDLGFLHQQELYITGRIKDMIIIRGRNHYPQEIERTFEQSHPALRKGHGAAFGINQAGKECLVIVQEVERNHWRSLDVQTIITSVRSAISQQHELQVYAICLLKPGSIPKTTSGKIQRLACRTAFLDGSLEVVASWQAEGEMREWGDGEMGRWGDGEAGTAKPVGVANLKSNIQNSKSKIPVSTSSKVEKTDYLICWLRDYASHHINSRLMDKRRCIAPHVVLDFGNQGLLGMQVPETYGGIALGHQDTMRVLQQLGAIDTTLALFVGLNNILGIRPILNAGSQSLREELLPQLASGRELAAFALTEPAAGSNPQAIASRAIPHPSGGWLLSGTKIWSGSAAWAGVINVFVQQQTVEGKLAGISGFAVRRGSPGLRQGAEALTMGMRGMVQNTVHLEQVPVNSEQLLGEPGTGMHVAQDAMMYGRLAIAAASVGGMKRCAQLMLRYSSRRSISTGRLLDSPVMLTRLNGLTAAITAVETLVTQIAQRLDRGESIPVEAYAACKTAAPEFYWQAADMLVQGLGGRGYIETNLVPQILRDARVLRIFEGPTETLNMFLGSRMLNNSTELQRFLNHHLETPHITQRLLDAIEQISDRLIRLNSLFSEPLFRHRWAAIWIGELTTFAILWAALENTVKQSESLQLQRSIRWITLQFEQKLAQALTLTPDESVLLNAETTTNLISNYIDAIGDIEQVSDGEDQAIDEILKKQHQDVKKWASEGILENPSSSPTSPPPSLPTSPTLKSIQAWLTTWLSQRLKVPPHAINPHQSFADYGIDSVMAVELAQDLQEGFGLQQDIEATIAWNFPNIAALADYLAGLQTPTMPLEIEEIQPSDAANLDGASEAELAELLANEIATAKRRMRR